MYLHGNWRCSGGIPGDVSHDFSIDARVPGCLHADLARAGIIGDMFRRDSADKVQWIENCDVIYSTSFTLDRVEPDMRLTFEGLDVYAEITLNGVKLGETDNMFVPWSYDVSHCLRTGENSLTVRFDSPIRRVKGLPRRGGAFTTERLYTRAPEFKPLLSDLYDLDRFLQGQWAARCGPGEAGEVADDAANDATAGGSAPAGAPGRIAGPAHLLDIASHLGADSPDDLA